MKIKFLKHEETIDSELTKDISVILVQDINDKEGEKMCLDKLKSFSKYFFRVDSPNGDSEFVYPFSLITKDEIRKEIQTLNSHDFFGKYFVAKCGGRN
jgi:hypothetical protein